MEDLSLASFWGVIVSTLFWGVCASVGGHRNGRSSTGIILGVSASVCLLPAYMHCMELLYAAIFFTNILLLARFVVFVIKPVVKLVANDHRSLGRQMRIIFFLIMSDESLFIDGLLITLMLSGILSWWILMSGVGATTLVLGFFSVAPVLTAMRILTVSNCKKPQKCFE